MYVTTPVTSTFPGHLQSPMLRGLATNTRPLLAARPAASALLRAPLRGVATLVDCSKVVIQHDQYGGAGAFANCDIARGELVESGIVRKLTNIDGNENP